MKWSEIHPGRDRYDFTAADRLVRFARSHGQSVHGHTLAWHQQNPEWLTTGTFTRAELIDILEEHIRTVVRRYRGRMANWDVVNEAGYGAALPYDEQLRPKPAETVFRSTRVVR